MKYCDKCKEDIERMEMGYNPHNGDCGRWQCHFLDILNAIVTLFLFIILFVPLVIFLLAASIIHLIRNDKNAVQEQRDEEVIHVRLAGKKQRKSRMEKHSMARRKQRKKK